MSNDPQHSSMVTLKLHEVSVWRGQRCLIDNLTLVSQAPVLHIAGENGAGKTTLLKCLSGLTQPLSGHVSWQWQKQWLSAREAGHLLAWVGHQDALNPTLTVLENLVYAVGLQRAVRQLELEQALAEHGLAQLAGLPARVLSAGQRRRVALVRAAVSQQPVWLLDEPYANLDEQGRNWVDGLVTTHVEAGGRLVLSTHQPPRFNTDIMQTLELGL